MPWKSFLGPTRDWDRLTKVNPGGRSSLDGDELELDSHCGFDNFERVVAQRKPHPPIVTAFVACVGCRAMYFAPQRPLDPPEKTIGSHMKAIGGPQPERVLDSAAMLKRDAAEAAKDYAKPGRSGDLSQAVGRPRSWSIVSSFRWRTRHVLTEDDQLTI